MDNPWTIVHGPPWTIVHWGHCPCPCTLGPGGLHSIHHRFGLKLMNLVLQAYKSVYDAAIFCLEHGGRLAERVEEPEEAVEHCTQIQGASPR